MRVGYKNLIDGLEIVASSEAPGFPIRNVQDKRMSRKWKSELKGPVFVDIPKKLQITMVVINAHNLSSGDIVKLQGYSDAGRATLVTTIDIDIREYAMGKYFTKANYYWSLAFVKDTPVEIGGIFLGDHSILPAYEIGHIVRDEIVSSFNFSATNQIYGEDEVAYRTATFILPTVRIPTERDELVNIWRTVGRTTPFYLLQYSSAAVLQTIFYCVFTMENLELQENEKNVAAIKDVTLSIREVF